MKINEILKLDLKEDIKSVIDLENQTENEIQQEIESYIVTDGISEHLHSFVDKFTSNIKETGVWISGFYGSGKSYFGKMLGYLIANPDINGTPARDRFIPRLRGVNNESLIENSIRKLDSKKNRVIFLDIAKQNTEKGLSYTLFSNFLKNIGFRNDIYGYIEFDLFIVGKYADLEKKSLEIFGKEWNEVKESNREVAKALRRIHIDMDYSEKEYDQMLQTYSDSINSFSPNKLKDELTKYLNKVKDETLVFIFDETSEAINQKKFKIDELQGMSEALSSISQRVWSIAIAQEKLDDIILNSNISRKDLNKVTDRFKTTIHLESTEVDIIIRNRLLQKKEGSFELLLDFYKKNDGQINETTNLSSSFTTKTENANEFAIYYPFHKYQFKLLQNFLFSSKILAGNQIATRGMIITTFDVLKKHLINENLYTFTNAYNLCVEGQKQPPSSLINKYDSSKQILSDKNLGIEGDKLLRTINFLAESQLVSTTLENITKSYITNIVDYYDFKPKVQKALEFLIDGKILLLSNNSYKITSDQESKILDQMNEFTVEYYKKKQEMLNYLKKSDLFKGISLVNEDSINYNFKVQTDSDDDIVASKNNSLKVKVYNIYSIDKDLSDFIEKIKIETQNTKDIITIIPDNKDFDKIDRLVEEIKRYIYIESEYSSSKDSDTLKIVRSFSSMKEEKEKDLNLLINKSYSSGSVIYMFDQKLLNKDTFKSTVNDVEKKLIKNIYTKRLSKQLNDSSAISFLTKKNNDELQSIVSGDDFKFFDASGNFTGDHLKIVDEISQKINKRFVDGKSIEEEFSNAPWGYSYGTILTTLSALFRAGRLVINFNGFGEIFDYKDKEVQEAFKNSKKFQNSSFKYINKTLSANKKHQLVEILIDLEYEKHTKNKVDWNTNDFELSQAIEEFSKHFIYIIDRLADTNNDFQKLFGNTINQKNILQGFTNKTTEANYIEKVEGFLNASEDYKKAIKVIIKTEKFIKNNYGKVKEFKIFAEDVKRELEKAGQNNKIINEKYETLINLFNKEVEANFSEIQQLAQSIKDEYFSLMKSIAEKMSEKYSKLKIEAENAKKELLINYPEELNESNIRKIDNLIDYFNKRIVNKINIDFQINCKNCNFTLSDMVNFTDLSTQRSNELIVIKASFIKEKSTPYSIDNSNKVMIEPKKIKIKFENKIITVNEYRNILTQHLQTIAGMDNEEKIELILD